MLKVGDKIKLDKTHSFFGSRLGKEDFNKIYTLSKITRCTRDFCMDGCPGRIKVKERDRPKFLQGCCGYTDTRSQGNIERCIFKAFTIRDWDPN